MSSYGAKGSRTPNYSLKADVPDGPRPWLAGLHNSLSDHQFDCTRKSNVTGDLSGYATARSPWQALSIIKSAAGAEGAADLNR